MHLPLALLASLISATIAAPLRGPVPMTTAVASPLAFRAVDGAKILAEVDRRAAAFADQRFEASMHVYKDGKLQKTMKFTSLMKGLDKQFIEFTAPGDVAGMKVLMQDAQTLYVYMPEFKKVRRVAAHVQSQGFLGSEFSYEDMTQMKLAPLYDAKLVGREGSLTRLELSPKEGVEVTFPKLELVIDSTKGGVTLVRYFDKDGNLVREQARTDWTQVSGQPVPTTISMHNHKTGAKTVIKREKITVNTGVDESVFSRRQLLRG